MTAADARARAGRTLSPALLLPGLGALLVSLAVYVQYQRAYPVNGLDLDIYRQAARAFLAGRPVYDLRFNLGLPYTYPPVTLPMLALLSGPGLARWLHVLAGLSIAALFLSVLAGTALAGYRGIAGRVGVAAATTALAIWLEPVGSNLFLGQVNALLLLLVVADLALPDRLRIKGIGIGVATACKLTPGIFVLYLLLTRRWRAAAVATTAFTVTTLVGCVVAPRESAVYWLGGLFLDPGRVSGATGPAFLANQSLRGVVLRTLGETPAASVVWVVLAAVVGVGGLALARLAHRRGEDAVAVVTTAFTGLLVSPVSWSHHWVWVVLLLPLVLDVARRTSGAAQVVASGVFAAWVVLLFTYPVRPKPEDPLQPTGVLWIAYRQPQPLHWLGENTYVPAVAAMMLLTAWWLRRTATVAPGLPAVDGPTERAVAAVPQGERERPAQVG